MQAVDEKTDRKAARRQQILTHAREIFARSGYHAAKIDDIVHAAGVARGTFYLYFEDKRAIFEEIVDRALARVGVAIERVDVERPIAEQVRGNIRRLVEVLLEDRATTTILLSGTVGVDPAFDKKVEGFYEEVLTLMEESLREGQELGIVQKGNARVFALLTMGALKELLSRIVVRGWEHPTEELVEEIFTFFRGGYLRME